MAKAVGRPFPKGRSGNPGGRPALPADVAELVRAGRDDLTRSLARLFTLPLGELERELERPETRAVDLAAARCLRLAIQHGDPRRLEFLLTRAFGKVREEFFLEATGGLNHAAVIAFLDQLQGGKGDE